MWAKIAVVGAGLVVFLFVLARYQGQNDQIRLEQYQAVIQDIGDGKTVSGTLAATLHVACITPGDAYNSVYGADNSQATNAQSQLELKLVEDQRCVFVPGEAHFDITTDGKERFTTPHGSLELWPAPHH